VLTPGTALGPYRIVEKIGEGGMGEVYKARDTRLDRTVALKLLTGPADEMASLRERLQHEARSLSQLNHPHICTLYDIAEAAAEPADAPVSYLVMEYLEGETLVERISRGPLAIDRALAHGAQIADALDKAHRAGIIHGDLKPGNVMVTKSGVKLLDFGLARRRGTALPPDWADAATRSVSLGTPRGVVGTLQYLAPEQLEGHPSDERSDIFACGAVLYEMLTGRRAFDGDTPAAVIADIMRRDLPAISSVIPAASSAVDHVVATCLAKDPDERWQHAGDLAHELRWLSTTAPKEERLVPGRPGQRGWQIAAGLLLLSTLGLVALLASGTRRAEPPTYRTSILLPDGLRFPTGGTVGGGGRMALSPDGRTLVVVVIDSTGRQMLWLRPLEGQTAMPLAGSEGAASPFWSPDSKSIGFVAQGQLKTIDVAGGDPVLIAASALNTTGAWSRSGDILFTPSASSSLWVVPAAGGAPRSVTKLDETAGDQVHRNPVFLPDGRHFLYVAVGGRNGAPPSRRAVYVGSLEANASPVLVLDNASIARYSDNYLLFMRDATLFAQLFDPERVSLSGEPRVVAEQLETGGIAGAGSFTLSDAGLLAYQTPTPAGTQLVWFDRQGRQLGSVGDAADYGDLELSPDGRQAVVSVLDASTNTRDLWIVDVTRGVRTRFTFDRGDDITPVWSRDGSRVLFTSNRTGHFDLYEKAASGIGAETLVYADASEKYPTSWLFDGKTLLYWTFSAADTELKLLSLGAGHPRTFLSSPVSPGRFAPDGRHVLYYSTESGRSEVYLVPYPAATRKWQISDAGGTFVRWRPDGKEVFYIGRDNKLVATSVRAETDRVEIGQPMPLFDARPAGVRYFYDVAPGGERFLVNTVRGASALTSVTLVQNWSRLLAP